MNTIMRFWRNIVHWLSNLYAAVTALSVIVFVVLSSLPQFPNKTLFGYRPNDDILFWGAFLSYVASAFMGFINKKAKDYDIKNITSSSEEKIQYFKDLLYQERVEALKDHLREIAESLKFSMEERICVYRFIEAEKQFECTGRYSLHHQYSQLSDRKRYPTDVGIIAHVWNNGRLNGFKRDNQIPDINHKKAEYFLYLKREYGIDRNIAKKFRMNPVDIIAEVIRDTKKEPIAIIIFESQRKNFLDEDKLKESYNDFKKEVIINSLDKLKDQNPPNLKTASEAQL